MDEIGLFPLGMVLLPSERVPLHVFEPRYRELIGECLDDDEEFGLVLADEDGLREVGTRAAVTQVLDRFDDGRLNVLVEGRERFRLVSLTSGRSYQTGEVEPVADEPGEPPAEEVQRAVEQLRRVAELAGADVGEHQAELLVVLEALADQLAVTRFEDVERHALAREQDDSQGEEPDLVHRRQGSDCPAAAYILCRCRSCAPRTTGPRGPAWRSSGAGATRTRPGASSTTSSASG